MRAEGNRARIEPEPPARTSRGDRADPQVTYADEAASEELGALVLKDSTEAWRVFLAGLKAARETGRVRNF